MNSQLRVPTVAWMMQTCGACPSQWEGELQDGRAVYIRFRHGWLQVGAGPDVDAAVRGAEDLYEGEGPNGLDGFLTFEQLRDHLSGVLGFEGVEHREYDPWEKA